MKFCKFCGDRLISDKTDECYDCFDNKGRLQTKIVCCETYGGDEIDNSYRMLFGHHPFCPLLKEIPKLMSKKQFDSALTEFYRFWKKTELDKIRNEFYASPPKDSELEREEV